MNRLLFVSVFVMVFTLGYSSGKIADFFNAMNKLKTANREKGTREWTYEDQSQWPEICRSGSRQSPINIDTTQTSGTDVNLNINQFNQIRRNVVLINDGYSVQVKLDPEDRPIVTDFNMMGYIFDMLSFSWGKDDNKGTEHSIDNRFGSLELLFISHNLKYDSPKEAENQSNGFLVISVLLNNTRFNKDLASITRALSKIKYPSHTILPEFNFGKLFPKSSKFFTYPGSMMQPPCLENVDSLVFKEMMPIQRSQLVEFRKLRDFRDKRVVNNRRGSIQPLNGREVHESNDAITIQKY